MPPASKRRKVSGVEEVTFDFSAREEYLTGFHKRKVQRTKHAQQEAAKKEREMRIEQRKQLREQRKQDLETHVETVNALLKKAVQGESDEESYAGLSDEGDNDAGMAAGTVTTGTELTAVREQEYVDEDKYTTVTVEPMNLSGSEKGDASEDDDAASEDVEAQSDNLPTSRKGQSRVGLDGKRVWTKEKPDTGKAKKKRKKFRYESKVERKLNRTKQAVKNSAAAKARRGE